MRPHILTLLQLLLMTTTAEGQRLNLPVQPPVPELPPSRRLPDPEMDPIRIKEADVKNEGDPGPSPREPDDRTPFQLDEIADRFRPGQSWLTPIGNGMRMRVTIEEDPQDLQGRKGPSPRRKSELDKTLKLREARRTAAHLAWLARQREIEAEWERYRDRYRAWEDSITPNMLLLQRDKYGHILSYYARTKDGGTWGQTIVDQVAPNAVPPQILQMNQQH